MIDTLQQCGSLWQRLRHGVRRLFARSDWARLAGADWAERIMQVALTDDFHAKQGRSTGRWVLRNGERQLAVYLKRHYQLAWWRGVLALLWPGGDWSPGVRELRNLEWAAGQGLPVPRVVAGGELVGPGARLQSFLAIEELTGMLALHEAIPLAARQMAPLRFRRWKARLLREVARLSHCLHQRRYFHKDLYLCHFYIPGADIVVQPKEWRGRVHVIDLHRLGHHPLTWPWWLVKDLGQLLYSSDVEGVEARDRWRFWRAYLGATARTWRGRLLARCVLLKGGRYREHNKKHPRHPDERKAA